MTALLLSILAVVGLFGLAMLGDHVMASLADQAEISPHTPPAVTGIRG